MIWHVEKRHFDFIKNLVRLILLRRPRSLSMDFLYLILKAKSFPQLFSGNNFIISGQLPSSCGLK
jgi:hypothetical protein